LWCTINDICNPKPYEFVQEAHAFNFTSRIEALAIQIKNSSLARKQQQLECDNECHIIQLNKSFTQPFSITIGESEPFQTAFTDVLRDYPGQKYGPIPAGKHRKSLERGSSIPTGKFSDFFR